ncbi:sigma-70 family RNA polymerase sigma factor [Clostridium perfringens]|uniref:sigma-70 family RNA polymerase sigma factor n=1 Tax=Clostridium perfringens TaxID=1502 RepID=UPI0008A716D5|nr:sigma-70 family RNA polymerase sigma factor [Clostridium perfringens]AOY53208.1 RNA polymerase sigma factor SigZ [Clostridium perfringens]MCC2764949.1 sigma-70 family RNA polymerase sigma factor [Clostridium perfringens]MCG4541965.1 sigma-70 family RNA polymerase sigma factor [Clostridium perfringens]MCG4544263.1 sigma-70 family RNA polymerase sigma factor [Clostridium perfringens]MCG4554735.1 sigma-70 family RNA polymerase sigma factor [Clostridium perfringens]
MRDNDLIKQLKKKNPKALDYIFNKYGNLIFKVSYSILNNRTLSEECVNDVLLKIWNNIDSFNKGDEKFKAWIIVMTKYTSIDMLRKEKILFAIKTFDKKNKEIFIKRFFLNYSIKEISESIGISENAISNRIRRGKLKLSELLIKEGF